MKTQIASAVTETLLYHEQTKHHFHRYARSAGFMDWANQPDPFRAYEGVTAVKLPLLQKDPASEHQALYERSRNAFQHFTRKAHEFPGMDFHAESPRDNSRKAPMVSRVKY